MARGVLNENVTPPKLNPFYPRFWEDRLNDVLATKQQKGIFVCDMSDLFGIGIPEEWTRRVLNEIRFNERRFVKPHRFYLLTKQPQNLPQWSPFPDNCWVGVTVTKLEFLLPALDAFDSIQCSVRYLSIEPMLAAFDVPDLSILLEGSVDLLILGSQTKPYRPPTIQAVEEIVRARDKAGVPVFLKDNLKPLIENFGLYPQKKLFYSETFPISKLRQEMPSGSAG